MARFERFASAGFKDFEDVVELYRSATGAVYCAKFKYDNCLYVLKERKVSELGKKKDVMNEVRLLSQLDHPNVIKCEGWFNDDDRQSLFIILEYCPGGDLSKKIEARRKSRRYFSEQYIWFLFYQICLGVQHLHINGIIHRDLKTLNVMLSKKDTTVKIADLGVSRQVSRNTSMLDTFIGTPLYLSPELVDNKPYNEKTDIWSLGVILYELCALTVPFRAANVLTLANMIRAAKYEPIPGIYSSHMERCIPWLLNTNYLNRPSINQVISYCEQRVKADYHGEDMAAEYDTLQHGVGRLVVGANSGVGQECGVEEEEERRREERFEVEHNHLVLAGIKEKVRSERLGRMERDLQQHHQQHQQQEEEKGQGGVDNSGDDDGAVSDDSLEGSQGRRRKESALLAGAREKENEREKRKDKDHRKRRPHTAGVRHDTDRGRRKGTEKAVAREQKEKDEQQTLIQFELSRIQILLRRELAQLRRLMKLKDFFGGGSGLGSGLGPGGEHSDPSAGIDKGRPVTAAGPHANYSQIGPLPPGGGATNYAGAAGPGANIQNRRPVIHAVNVVANNNDNNNNSDNQSGTGSLERKLAEVNQRIAILERGVRSGGVLSRADVQLVDALRALISVQEITVLPDSAEEEEEEEAGAGHHHASNNRSPKRKSKPMLHHVYKEALRQRPDTEVEYKRKGPVGYRKLAGRHRDEEQNRGDDHFEGLICDPRDAARLAQLRIHESEGMGGAELRQQSAGHLHSPSNGHGHGHGRNNNNDNNAALNRKIEVMRYQNPFEALGGGAGGGREAFKQKNLLDYDLFVPEDGEVGIGVGVGVGIGGGVGVGGIAGTAAAAAGGGMAAAKARRRPRSAPSDPNNPTRAASAPTPTSPPVRPIVRAANNSQLGDTDSGSGGDTEDEEEKENDGGRHPLSHQGRGSGGNGPLAGYSKSHAVHVPALKSSSSKQEAASAVAAVLHNMNKEGGDNSGGAVQQIEVSTKSDGTVVLTVRAPAPSVPVLDPAPPKVSKEPKEPEFRGGYTKGGLYLGNGTAAEVTPQTKLSAAVGEWGGGRGGGDLSGGSGKAVSSSSNSKTVTINEQVSEIPLPSLDAPATAPLATDGIGGNGNNSHKEKEFVVRPPSPKPAVIPKCTLFNTQRDKVTGKIGNPLEEAGAGIGARAGEGQKVYKKPQFARKKLGSAFKGSEIDIDWFPGKLASEPAPALAQNVVVNGAGCNRDASSNSNSNSNSSNADRSEARRNRRLHQESLREERLEEQRLHTAGKRFNIIAGAWE